MSQATFAEGAAPATPASGKVTLYAKTDGLLYAKDDAGTEYPVSNVLGANVAAFLATPTSANLAAALTNETGSGSAVFATSPTLVTPLLGTPTSGNLANCAIQSANPAAPIGYQVGAGGVVTQLTSKATGVTLNAACGAIVMHNESLAAGATVTFTFTNSSLLLQDVVITNTDGFPVENYTVKVGEMANGSCEIAITNDTAGALTDALIIRFAILRVIQS